MTRFTNNTFQSNYLTTIGVDFGMKTIDIDNTIVKCQIWDPAGQQKFSAITSSYFNGAHILFFVFDVTNLQSF